MKDFYIVTFNNTHEAMLAESICGEKKLKVTMMPTPTYITKSCGISLKVNLTEEEKLRKIVNEDSLAYKSIYELRENKIKEINFKY